MEKEKEKFTVMVTYFKPSGKYYTESKFEVLAVNCGDELNRNCYMYDVLDELRRLNEAKQLPGLTGGWSGPIHVSCDEGHPCLILDYLK